MTERSRLSRLDQDVELLPLRRAKSLKRCYLYWIPVAAFPVPEDQRIWINTFLDRLSAFLKGEPQLRPEIFLQYKSIHPHLADAFLDHAEALMPILGYSFRPGMKLPPIPTVESMEAVMSGKEKLRFEDHVGDFCCWFLRKGESQQRALFFGFGGMTVLFLPPDPNLTIVQNPFPRGVREHPTFKELFARFDVEEITLTAKSLNDRFLKQSLELFRPEVENNLRLKGVPFIIPLLRADDFFLQPEELADKWFTLFQLYVNESPVDKGILLASKDDYELAITSILSGMRNEGVIYRER